MRAIQTRYAGHHFRSRLEARRAVIFTALGLRWEYEPQGYEWSESEFFGGFPAAESFLYLPDFFLPERNVYVEVKGDPSIENIRMLASAAVPHWGLPDRRKDRSRLGDRILIVGKMPDEGCAPSGVMLYWWKGWVFWYPWTPAKWQDVQGAMHKAVYGDSGEFDVDEAHAIVDSLNNANWPTRDYAIRTAASVGRCARFEHGESPAVPA